MTMIGSNQISFRDKSDAEKKSSNKIPIKEEDMPLTEAVTEPDNSEGEDLSSEDVYEDNYADNGENYDIYE